MAKLDPYLNFPGNAEEAFDFYRSVFGGEFAGVMRWRDNESCSEWPEADKNKIMHIALPIGDSVLMGSDVIESMDPGFAVGTNVQITITPDSREHADRIFRGLSGGGTVIMAMQDMFWGAYWGAAVDKFGIHWMLNLDQKPAAK